MHTRKSLVVGFVSLFVLLWGILIAVEAGDNWTHYRLGQKYLKEKKYDMAANNFNYYLRNADLHARMAGIAHFGLGLLYEDMGETRKAISEYNMAINKDIHPDISVKVKAYMNLGAIFMRRQEYEEAISSYSKAIEGDHTNGLAHYYLGMAFLKTGRYDLAEKESIEAHKLGVPLTALSERLEKRNKDESKGDSGE